jgi:hypothetical protein
MTSFALSSSTQFFECLHDNPASSLDSLEVFCVECSLEREGSSVENALNLHEVSRAEQESEHVQHLPILQKDGEGHEWTDREGEIKEQIYDITNRLPSWLWLGSRIFPMLKPDELSAYLALPSTDTICISCHLQVNRFVGCLQCVTPSQSLYNEISRVLHS